MKTSSKKPCRFTSVPLKKKLKMIAGIPMLGE